ncbi:MAG: sigma-70 family RNA polymerase sigma factor [Acidobacteriota bacterium]
MVALILRGDSQAEDWLVERYSRPLFALLRQRLRETADAEDFLQDTLQLGIAKIRQGELREPAKLGSFLMSLARNLVIEHHRRKARRKTDADSPITLQRAASEPEPEAQLIASERASLTRHLLGELGTPRDREILTRFYLAEEDKPAICEDLGLSSSQFNCVLHRARERYKQLFEARFGSPWGERSRLEVK